MPKSSSMRTARIAALCAMAVGAAPAARAQGAVPNFAPDARPSWGLDQTVDDLLPPPWGAGPITFDPAHPYVPNFRGAQPTYRVADLSNCGGRSGRLHHAVVGDAALAAGGSRPALRGAVQREQRQLFPQIQRSDADG